MFVLALEIRIVRVLFGHVATVPGSVVHGAVAAVQHGEGIHSLAVAQVLVPGQIAFAGGAVQQPGHRAGGELLSGFLFHFLCGTAFIGVAGTAAPLQPVAVPDGASGLKPPADGALITIAINLAAVVAKFDGAVTILESADAARGSITTIDIHGSVVAKFDGAVTFLVSADAADVVSSADLGIVGTVLDGAA